MLLYLPILYILGYVVLFSKTLRNRAASAWHYAYGIAPFVGVAISVATAAFCTMAIILVFFLYVQIKQGDYEVVGFTLQIIGVPLLILSVFYTVIMNSVVNAITGIKTASKLEVVDSETGEATTPPPNIEELQMLTFGYDKVSHFIKALFFPTDEMKKMFLQGKSIVSSGAEGVAFHLHLLGRNILFILYIVFCSSLVAYFIPEATDYKLVLLLLAGTFFVVYWMFISSDPKDFENVVRRWAQIFGKPVVIMAILMIYFPPAMDALRSKAQATFIALERQVQKKDAETAREIGGTNYDQIVFITTDLATLHHPNTQGGMSAQTTVIGKGITLWLATTHEVNGEECRKQTTSDGRIYIPVWWKKSNIREPEPAQLYWYPDVTRELVALTDVVIDRDYPAP
jgi:hypothetical protein